MHINIFRGLSCTCNVDFRDFQLARDRVLQQRFLGILASFHSSLLFLLLSLCELLKEECYTVYFCIALRNNLLLATIIKKGLNDAVDLIISRRTSPRCHNWLRWHTHIEASFRLGDLAAQRAGQNLAINRDVYILIRALLWIDELVLDMLHTVISLVKFVHGLVV